MVVSPTEIYLTARQLVGTPYHHQGRQKDLGVDCIGVPIWVARQLNLQIADPCDYCKQPDGTMLQKIQAQCPTWFLTPGALLVFQIRGIPSHCAIASKYMGGLGMIHAWDVAGVVVENRLTDDWLNRIVGCYSIYP